MTIKPLLLVLLFLKAFSSFASGADTLKIFYPIKQYSVPNGDSTKIAAFAGRLTPTDTLTVIGYADYLGNSTANITLSQNRARVMKDFILGANKNLVIITVGKGALPATAARSSLGEPNSRRVDIIVTIPPPAKKVMVTVPAPQPKTIPHDSVSNPAPPDSVVELATTGSTSFEDKVNSIEKLAVGSSLSLEELTFQMSQHFLNAAAGPYLATLMRYLKKHKNITFEIRGHVCCQFGDMDGYDRSSKEQTLSVNRAKYIYDYFIRKGIAASRMTYKGVGASQPEVWPEKSWYDQYLNRRVEIVITGK